MANKNFEIKNGLTVAGIERITSAGLVTGTTTTQAASDNTTKLASTAYVTTALANLSDSAPSTLNTLNELAAALGDDANYATTTTNAIAAKAPLASPSFTGTLSVSTVVKLGTFSQDGQTNGFIGFDQSSSDVGLGFGHSAGTGRVYYPCRENGSGVSDVISLGTSTYKYKDLHLSGTVSAANLTLDSGALGPHLSFENVGGSTRIKESDSASLYYQAYNHTFEGHTGIDRLHISQIGDISFYEDTGTTAKLFWDASTERLGIGTASPYTLLELSSTDPIIRLTDSNGVADKSIYEMRAIGSSSYESLEFRSVNDANNSYDKLLVLKYGGNVGIGTDQPDNILHVKTTASGGPQIHLDTGTGSAFMNFDGTNLQLSTQRDMVDGTWHDTSKSWGGININGTTSGSNITFNTAGNNNTSPTTRMTIDKDGFVGIGTSSTLTAPLEINGGAGMTGGWGRSLVLKHAFPTLVWQSTYSTDAYAGIAYDNTTGMKFMVNSPTIDIFANSQTPALTILDNKNVGIGTASPQNKLHIHVDGVDSRMQFTNNSSGTAYADGLWVGHDNTQAYFMQRENHPVSLWTNATKRMIIHEDGRILMNTPDPHNGGPEVLHITTTGASGGYGINIKTASSSGGTMMRFNTTGAIVGQITTSGSATTYHTSSDARLKDITGKARGLEVINKLNPVSYTWKLDGSADEGFIAQEVEKLIPNVVHQNADDDMYSMDYGRITPLLVKAIQEQQTIIQELEARIETLEG